MKANRIVDPVADPVSLSEARAHLREPPTEDNIYITDLIGAATAAVESETQRSLADQTWELWLDDFPSTHGEPWWGGARLGSMIELRGRAERIKLPHGPVQSVTSVTIFARDNTSEIWPAENYRMQNNYLIKNDDVAWPVVGRTADGVRIEYVTGFQTVPTDLKQAILLTIANWFNHREPVLVGDTKALLDRNVAGIIGRYKEMDL